MKRKIGAHFVKFSPREFAINTDDFPIPNVEEWHAEWQCPLKFLLHSTDFGAYIKTR